MVRVYEGVGELAVNGDECLTDAALTTVHEDINLTVGEAVTHEVMVCCVIEWEPSDAVFAKEMLQQ